MANPNPWVIQEEQWTLVDEVQATMSPSHDRLLIRRVTGIDPTYLNLVVDDLRMRTSARNNEGERCNWVKDPLVGCAGPVAGSRTFEGIWRGVSVRGRYQAGQSSGTVIQTLAYGLIRTSEDVWPDPELVAESDRLIRPHAIQDGAAISQREVRYRGFDPSYISDAQEQVATGSTAPFLGDANVVEAKSVRMQDGSYNLHVLYENINWVAFNVASPDTTADTNFDTPFQGKREEWNSIANTDALTDLYTSCAAGYRINDVTPIEQLDGSLKIVRDLVLARVFTVGSPDIVWYEEQYNGHGGKIKHEQWFNIDQNDALAGLDTESTGYTMGAKQITPNGNGTKNVHRTQTQVVAFDASSPHDVWYERKGQKSEVMHELWYNIEPEDPFTDLETAPSGYAIVSAQPDLNSNGTRFVHRVCTKKNAFDVSAPDTAWYEDKPLNIRIMHEKWINVDSDDPNLDQLWSVPPTGYTVGSAPIRDNENGTSDIERISALSNTWWTTVISGGSVPVLGTNAVVFSARGLMAGFSGATYAAENIPVDDAPLIVAAFMNGATTPAWQGGGYAYIRDDMVTNNGLTYVCASAHFSSADFGDDVGLYRWLRVTDCSWQHMNNGVARITFAVEQACETGSQVSGVSPNQGTAEEEVYRWEGVDPSRLNGVWAQALLYAGTSNPALFHKDHHKVYNAIGVATVTASAWDRDPSGASVPSVWQGVSGQHKYEHISRTYMSGQTQVTEQKQVEVTYDVSYWARETDAYTAINDGLEGSSVSQAAEGVWRSIKITGRDYSYGAWATVS